MTYSTRERIRGVPALGRVTDRSDYWDQSYANYWRARVQESNEADDALSMINEGDALTLSDALYISFIDTLGLDPSYVTLELGCGYGRAIPYLSKRCSEVYAADISKSMLDFAREKCGELSNVYFTQTEAEYTPYEVETFDRIICFGVFDALKQKEALLEFNRLLKVGGSLLVTGKNTRYLGDDEQAYIAEVNARAKGHPNHFTDVQKLLGNTDKLGFELREASYFKRRGDFGQNIGVSSLPESFYEFALILDKTDSVTTDPGFEVASVKSQTWRERQAGGQHD